MPLPLLIAGGLAVAGGLAKTIWGAGQAKKYRKMIENYNRQELMNPYEYLKVSTLGAMLEQRNSAQNTATALYNLRQSGVNSIIGGTSRVLEENNLAIQKIGADLDKQQNLNEQYKAYGRGIVQNMQEKREEDDLAGFGTAMNVGRQAMWDGVSDMVQGGLVVAGNIDPKVPRKQVDYIKTNKIGMDENRIEPSWGALAINPLIKRKEAPPIDEDILEEYNMLQKKIHNKYW